MTFQRVSPILHDFTSSISNKETRRLPQFKSWLCFLLALKLLCVSIHFFFFFCKLKENKKQWWIFIEQYLTHNRWYIHAWCYYYPSIKRINTTILQFGLEVQTPAYFEYPLWFWGYTLTDNPIHSVKTLSSGLNTIFSQIWSFSARLWVLVCFVFGSCSWLTYVASSKLPPHSVHDLV